MNKRGFAISVVLYSIVFLLISILYMVLGVLKTRYNTTNNLRESIMEEMDDSVRGVNAADYILANAPLEVTPYGMIYTGSNPDNYVIFNGEQWRIIGVYGDKLKIVKAIPYSSQAFDSISGNGNEWRDTSLSNYLNNTYYQTLKDEAKNMINENSSWYVGKIAYNITANNAYTGAQTTTWNGNVGLVSTYEYLYAAGSACQNVLSNTAFSPSCSENDWLWMTLTRNKNKDAWTMSPNIVAESDANRVLDSSGIIDYHNKVNAINISPVVYLKSDTKITSGDGKNGYEYILK